MNKRTEIEGGTEFFLVAHDCLQHKELYCTVLSPLVKHSHETTSLEDFCEDSDAQSKVFPVLGGSANSSGMKVCGVIFILAKYIYLMFPLK